MTSAWERTAQQPELRAPHGCRILRGRTCMRARNARELQDPLMDSRSGTCSSASISAIPTVPGPAYTLDAVPKRAM